ncbi:MAG: LacI family DNA-binding transcriptional regulator, partial [[Clostridium] scindens]
MNINEIARLAGVSRATVSRYLNDGYVSDEKKAVIRKVIE